MNETILRRRSLSAFSLAGLDALPKKATIPIVLPTGAIEQHGPHLPVGVDSLLGEGWLHHALPKLSATTPCLVAPAIVYGKSNEHLDFPGTVALDKSTFAELVWVTARQLDDWGFRVLTVLNTHGGNIQLVRSTLREIHAELGLLTSVLEPAYFPPVDPQERQFGFHAGQVETAWMLALAPELVHLERASATVPAHPDDPGELRPEAAPAIFSWKTTDLSATGIVGDATKANREDGLAWIEAGAEALAASLEALAAWAASDSST